MLIGAKYVARRIGPNSPFRLVEFFRQLGSISFHLSETIVDSRIRGATGSPVSGRPSTARNARRQKQSSEAIMSFRMQNSSFRLAALGTFTFKCKLAECAPQSRPRHIHPHLADPFSVPPRVPAPIRRPLLLFRRRRRYGGGAWI